MENSDWKRNIGNEALPCPFCGGSNLVITGKEFFAQVYENHKDEIKAPGITITCEDCNTVKWDYGDTIDYDGRCTRLINDWNRRQLRYYAVREKDGDGDA